MIIRIGVLLALVTLVACQTPPQTQELLDRNQDLQAQLGAAESQIDALEIENQSKQQDIEELNRVIGVLDAEKSSRVQESSGLRSQIRGFIQGQIDALREFLVLGDLLDYIGDELVDRAWVEDESLLLVDLDNPAPRNGSLTGVAAHVSNPTSFIVKILRPVEDELVVIWESKLIGASEAGLLQYNFPVSVGIEKGDFLGYYFPETTGVGFDEGTGNTRYSTRDVRIGDSIRRASLKGGDKKRAYSIGVYALLNLN